MVGHKIINHKPLVIKGQLYFSKIHQSSIQSLDRFYELSRPLFVLIILMGSMGMHSKAELS